MPELPEVETVRSRLAPHLAGRVFARVEILDERLTRPAPPGVVAAELVGERVAAVERRGKYLIVRFESGRALLIHLRMTGSVRVAGDGALEADPYRRALVRLDDGSDVAYRDVRRFGTWLLLEPGEVDDYLAERLGAEPLERAFTTRVLAERLAGRRAPVKAVVPRPARRRRPREHLRGRGALVRGRPSAQAGGIADGRGGRGCPPRRAPCAQGGHRAPGGDPAGLRHARTGSAAPCRTSFGSMDGTTSRAAGAGRRSRRPGREAAARGTARIARRDGPAGRLFATRLETTLDRVGRTYKTEAVVLRSIRYAEADRILHLYTADRGRIGAIAKGVRRTTSRFGGRLEPLGHVELMLHQGGGELHTVTGVELIRAHRATRENPYRLAVGLVGAEAMLRLFTEQEANERAFAALTRFLDLLDDAPAGLRPDARSARSLLPAEAALALGLSAAPGELRGVRKRRTACGLLGAGGRHRLRRVQRRGAGAVGRRAGRHGRTAEEPSCRRAGGRADGARRTGRSHRDHLVVRGARRVPPANAQRRMIFLVSPGGERREAAA